MVKPRSSISLKITALVLCGASIVFALALAYSYSYSRRIILEEAEKGARGLTLSVARKIEQEFRAAAKIPEHLAAVSGNERPGQGNADAAHEPDGRGEQGSMRVCRGL